MTRRKAHKIGEALQAVGFFGAMIGGMALDGPDMIAGLIIVAISAMIGGAGVWIYENTRPVVHREPPQKEHDKARQEAVFQEWLEHGTLMR